MPSYVYESPVWLKLVDFSFKDLENLKSELTYESGKVREELKRLKNATWMEAKIGREAWIEQQKELEDQIEVCLVEGSHKGGYRVLSGFADRLNRKGWRCIAQPKRPEEGILATENKMKEGRYYQNEMVEALIKARHACVSASTGSGKSLCITKLIKELGLCTVVMAPSKNIAGQLYDELVDIFGKKRVGLVGDGKRDYKKQIVVGIAASLSNIANKKDSDEFKVLSKAEVFITDESHLVAALTFARVAQELMTGAWYRFFMSATQFRNDGADLLLEGLTGPEVYSYPLEKAVAEGYLAKPKYYMFEAGVSPRRSYSNDVMEMLRMHQYSNPDLHRKAAQLINNFMDAGYQTLVLIEEIQQFRLLLPYLTWAPAFAHGGGTKEDMAKLPEHFRKPNVKELVRSFNSGETKLLVGTSCIGTGTDTRPVQALLYLQGGRSEVQVRQAIGRGTRLVPGKKDFVFADFSVKVPGLEGNKCPLTRHAKTRASYYSGFEPVTYVPI